MPRPVRIEYAGALYHVMCRGDRREPIFRGDADRELFLRTWGEASQRAGFLTHAYVLMGNHYHVLLETPAPNLVAGMAWFQSTYTIRFNVRHRLCGHLFQGRYKAVIVDGADGDSVRRVADYIHLNPARARLLGRENPRLETYAWSSFPVYAGQVRAPEWLVVDRYHRLLGFETLPPRPAAEAQVTRMAALVGEVLDAKKREYWQNEWAELRRGWCLGGPSFRKEMRKRATWMLEGRKPGSLLDRARTEEEEEQARRLLDQGVQELAITLEEIQALKSSDPRKEVLAWLLKSKTPMKNAWISHALQLGHASRVSMSYRSVQMAEEGPRADWRQRINSKFKD